MNGAEMLLLAGTQAARIIGTGWPGGGRRGRDDRSLAGTWLALFAGLPQAVQDEHRIVACGGAKRGTFYFYSPARGLWLLGDRGAAAQRLMSSMKSLDGGRFWSEVLTPEERRYVGALRGQKAVLTAVIAALGDEDEGFEGRLDARLDILPFANGAVELTTGRFRALRWDDYVTRTTGYDYVAREDVPQAAWAFMESFYASVLPVPEEREVFLRAAGAALSGNAGGDEFLLVVADARASDSGKSTVLGALAHALGAFAAPAPFSFLHTCAEVANWRDLHYRGRRLAVFDELNNARPLNAEKMRRITGARQRIALRGTGHRAPAEFEWTAAVFVACNCGKVPRFTASDAALTDRMVVVPFRAKFDDAAAAAGEEHARPRDPSVYCRLKEARAAHVHLLLDAYARYRAAGSRLTVGLPPGCLGWRRDNL